MTWTQFVRASGDTTGATDYANIQAAFSNTNVRTVLLDGVYYLNAGLSITTANQALTGSGPGTVINCVTDAFNAITVGGTYDRRVRLSNFMVQGGLNAVAVVGGADLAIPTQDVWIENILADDQANAAVLLSNARDCNVNQLISNSSNYGVEVTKQSVRIQMNACRITQFDTYGVYHHGGYVGTPAYGGHTLRITNCTINQGGGDAIHAIQTATDRPGDNLQVRDCALEGNTGYAVNANYAGIGVTGCTIESNTAGGVLISVSEHTCLSPCVANCYFEGNGAADIQLATSGTGQIWNPTVMHNIGSGAHAFVAATGANVTIPYAHFLMDYYYRSSGGSVRYDVGRTLNKAIIHIDEWSYHNIPATGEGGVGYQLSLIPAS